MSAVDAQASEEIYGFSNVYDMMRAARDPILNEAVCASEAISNTNDCGTVSDTSLTWTSETENIKVSGGDTTGIAPIIGDSGSPLYSRISVPAKPGVPAHNEFVPIGIIDHENGYFARVQDALSVWGATICC
jgi:hypothetical protein